MNGAGAIVELLKAAGLLREEAGELVATFDEQPAEVAPGNGPPARTPEAGKPVISASINDAIPVGTDVGIRPAVSIHVQVRCTADEIEDLAPRLKALLRELSTED
jgi:hypothetical protein